jgi:N-acetylglucosamine-6-phosphate deacetylase
MAARYMIKAEQCVLSEGKMSEGKVYVTVTGDTITSIDTAEPPPTGCPIISTHLLTPGFIDIHLHGLGGADDVIDFWTNPGHTLGRLPAKGTTGCLATIVLPKEGREKTRRLAERLGECVGVPGMGAILEGIHAEGPVVNDCGGLPVSDVDITLDDFQSLIDSMRPHLKVMTISPHLEAKNNYSRIKALLERGIKPALGHDRVASEADIIGALRQSPDQLHITHIFNVSSFNNRNPSLVNFGMLKRFPNLQKYNHLPLPPTVEVIGDLAHVHPLTLSLLLQSRDPRDVCFITDGVYEASSPGQSISYNERTRNII